MSVIGYEYLINGPLKEFMKLSSAIGAEVGQHAVLVELAFKAQFEYIQLAAKFAQPSLEKKNDFLKPTSDQINAIQQFREQNRSSRFFNHLSAVSESIAALGWVCVMPTPGPHVKEMTDAGQFYANRVLKEWKEKDTTHVKWVKSWIETLTKLQEYIKQYHTTGLMWTGTNQPLLSSNIGYPPPPPPPISALKHISLEHSNDERSALFAEINQGETITKTLKKVTDDMKTHKNATLRSGPAPFKAPQDSSKAHPPMPPKQRKDPVFTKDGKKWQIEYQTSNPNLIVESGEMNNVIYMFRCENSTLTVKGKVNSIVMDCCKKCSVLFDAVVASVEFVNCQSVQMQVLNKVPTISIDKTDGCQIYLSKNALDAEVISSKSSEMNVMIPNSEGDYVEHPVPEQFKTTIRGNSLLTSCVESLA